MISLWVCMLMDMSQTIRVLLFVGFFKDGSCTRVTIAIKQHLTDDSVKTLDCVVLS